MFKIPLSLNQNIKILCNLQKRGISVKKGKALPKVFAFLAILVWFIYYQPVSYSASDYYTIENMEQVNHIIQEIFNKKDNVREREPEQWHVKKCATPIIKYALKHKELLWPENRFILFRPSGYTISYEVPYGHFMIHYTETGSNAVPGSDADPDTIPYYILNLASCLEYSWSQETGVMGYRVEHFDGTIGGGFNLIDVYVRDISSYGYTAIENDYLYIVIDKNMDGLHSDFDNDPNGMLKVTVAHELFHLIQYEYEFWFAENIWWEESTAVWMEDEVYDHVNDYLRYLPSRFSKFHLPIDYNTYKPGYFEYGGVIFSKFLSETYGSYIIRDIFEQCLKINPPYATRAIGDVLGNHNSNWSKTLRQFCIKNLKRDYQEGDSYPSISFFDTITLKEIENGALSNLELDHLACHYIRIRPEQDYEAFYLNLTASEYGTSPIAILMADTENYIYPSKDVLELNAYSDMRFVINRFGSFSQYPQAYLIVINPDPTNDNFSYSLNAKLPQSPVISDPASGQILIADEASFPFLLTLSIKNVSLDFTGTSPDLLYNFELYKNQDFQPIYSRTVTQDSKGTTSCKIEVVENGWYQWRCLAKTIDGKFSSLWTPMASFYLLKIIKEAEKVLSPYKDFSIKVVNPGSPIDGASVEGFWDDNTNQAITIAYSTDPGISTGEIVPIGIWIYLGPEGLDSLRSVKITIPYTQNDLDKAGLNDPNKLGIYQYQIEDSNLSPVPFVHIPEKRMLEGSIEHFSLFFLGYNKNALSKQENGSSDSGCFIHLVSPPVLILGK